MDGVQVCNKIHKYWSEKTNNSVIGVKPVAKLSGGLKRVRTENNLNKKMMFRSKTLINGNRKPTQELLLD